MAQQGALPFALHLHHSQQTLAPRASSSFAPEPCKIHCLRRAGSTHLHHQYSLALWRPVFGLSSPLFFFPTIQLLMRKSVIFSGYVLKVLISMWSSAWYNCMTELQIYRSSAGFCWLYWNHSHKLHCCKESHDYFGFLFHWKHGSYMSDNQKDYFGRPILLESTISLLYDVYSRYAAQMFGCIWHLKTFWNN